MQSENVLSTPEGEPGAHPPRKRGRGQRRGVTRRGRSCANCAHGLAQHTVAAARFEHRLPTRIAGKINSRCALFLGVVAQSAEGAA